MVGVYRAAQESDLQPTRFLAVEGIPALGKALLFAG
jgi:hypothetical protein